MKREREEVLSVRDEVLSVRDEVLSEQETERERSFEE